MRKKIGIIILCVYFLNMVFPSFNTLSQIKGEPAVFTLDQCIDIALKNNPDIQLANARITASSADITNAFGQFLPSINFSSGYNKFFEKSISFLGSNLLNGYDFYNMDLSASLVVFNGFSNTTNYKRAQENYNALYLNLKYTSQKVKMDVYRQFIDVVKKSQILVVRQQNIETGKGELERIKARYEVGTAPVSTVYTQEAEMGNREYDFVVAENDVNVSKAQLLSLMGMNPELKAEFTESSLPEVISTDDVQKFRLSIGSVNKSINNAIQNRDDYSSLKSQSQVQELNINLATSNYYPTVSAFGGWRWSNNTLTNFDQFGKYSFGLNFSLPIFDNFTTNYRIQAAKLQLKQSELQLSQLDRSIRSAVQTVYMNLEAAEKLLDITERALKSANENFESAKERFNVGAASITDYLLANQQLLNAKINRITVIYNYYQAQKEIMFAVGKL